ncbi:MAG: competence protein CoiA [Alphaproteobacteria bacterium]|nr:competence protein CoiA [Alphaproteobacteria bacterium]
MLSGIKNSSNSKVFARNVTKEDAPFSCPGCRGELTIKKGNIKTHHFAHKPPFNCSRGQGETDAHRKCKEDIFLNLSTRQNVTHLDLEADFGTSVADIFCRIDGIPVAIEIQKSDVTVNQITLRTQNYHLRGINVLWLALYNPKLDEKRYSPKAWEKWCHAAYFGRVYYWINSLTVLPVHFAEYRLDVECSSWYDEYGEEQSAGGYTKRSKRYRAPLVGSQLDIATDFRSTTKDAWSRGTVSVPQCSLYVDRLRKWW